MTIDNSGQILNLISALILFCYSLYALMYPNKIKKQHEKDLEKSNNIFSRFALNISKNQSNTAQNISAFGCLILSLIIIYLIVHKLFCN